MAKNTTTWIVFGAIALFVLMFHGMFHSHSETQATATPQVLFSQEFVNPPTTATAGQHLSYQVKVSNVGSVDGALYVDSGLYPRSEIEGWYGKPISNLFALQTMVENVNNCKDESFVQRKQVTLAAGSETMVTFDIVAPSAGTYYLHAGSFEKCWMQAGDEGYRSGKVASDPVVVSAASTTGTTASATSGATTSGTTASFDLGAWWSGLGASAYIIVGILVVLGLVLLFPQKKE